MQAQYESNQASSDELTPDGRPQNQNQFVLRRARLRFDHGWQYAAATFELDGTTAGGVRIGIRRGEATLLYRGSDDDSKTPLAAFTLGVTDIPFGFELGEIQKDRIFMERSIGSLALFPSEADVSAKIWGAYEFVNYAVALVNGQPVNGTLPERDPNEKKDLVGRLGVSTSPNPELGIAGGASFYKGQGFHAGTPATKDTTQWVDIDNDGVVDTGDQEIVPVPGTAAQPSENFDRWALGVDLAVVLETSLGLTTLGAEAFIASNMDRGLVVADPTLTQLDAREAGYTLGLTQQVTQYGVFGVRAAFYDPNSDLIEQRAGNYVPKTQSYFVLSPVVGVTVPHAKLLAQYDIIQDYEARDERGVPTDAQNNQLTLRVQVDL